MSLQPSVVIEILSPCLCGGLLFLGLFDNDITDDHLSLTDRETPLHGSHADGRHIADILSPVKGQCYRPVESERLQESAHCAV